MTWALSYLTRVRLGETIGRWIGRVEIALAGAEDDFRDAESALAAGQPMRARTAAKRILARAPDSPIGLALLADACEAAGLHAELALTLDDLSKRVPSRAEVWLRLARARDLTGAAAAELRDDLVRGLAVAESGSETRRETLLALADVDLTLGDGARAELWLERLVGDSGEAVAVRWAEARLAQGDPKGALVRLERFDAPAIDGRAALARGRALAAERRPEAFTPLLRAMVLDTRGASEALSSTLAWVPSDETVRARIRAVVEAKAEMKLARWRAAFARAEGQRGAARDALREAVVAGDGTAAEPLLDAALDDRDASSLAAALAALPMSEPLVADARRLLAALHDPSRALAALDELRAITSPRVVPWAEEATRSACRAIAEASGASWDLVLPRLDTHARALADLDAVARVASLSAERSRPVRVAIVGEFNAGKSTFINALIGAEIAPMGVLPTTATLHHLRYAPDAIARIFFSAADDPPERIVAVGDLRAALKSVAGVSRVEILLPIASLTRVEILDTPGFNAPDASHTAAARAAFEEADAAIWLLDAGQPMKQSERIILEEAKASRLPIQLLINKADRLDADGLAKVLESVRASIDEIAIDSLAPPLALSAKRALAGKLGDAAALEASGWGAVQSLLDDQIVGRSGVLKERALRRRAAAIVGTLLVRAADAATRERSEAEALTARAHRISQVAATLERDIDAVAERLAAGLAGAATAWRRDLAVAITGRDADAAAADRALARYRVDRAIAHLAPPLARALASASGDVALSPAETLRMARPLVRTAAACADDFDALVPPLARASIATLSEHLFALAVAPSPAPRARGLERELIALRDALLT
jgi:small GTP-binding protein